MDGYAVSAAQVAPGDRFTVIGESAAGAGFAGRVGAGQCVRIFTGAPLPEGADRVIIQEDVTRQGDVITLARRPRMSAGRQRCHCSKRAPHPLGDASARHYRRLLRQTTLRPGRLGSVTGG